MNDLIRIFFLFSISVVAFSQYLRSSSSQEVKDIKDRLRSYEDHLRSLGERTLHLAQNNEQFSELKNRLYSKECAVPSDTIWYYILFLYLSGLIVFGAAGKFFNSKSPYEYIQLLYVYRSQISGTYCLVGLVLCYFVFRSGYRAIAPKENARNISDNIDTSFRTISGFRSE